MTCVDHFRGLTRNASAYSTNSRHQWLGARHTAAIVIRVGKNKETSDVSEVSSHGGSERHRSADLTIFSRSLYQLSYRAMNRNLFERPRPDLNR